MKTTIVLSLLAAVAVVGLASAEPLATIPDAAGALGGDLYVNDDATVWQETNGVAGLQTEAVDDVPADTQLA